MYDAQAGSNACRPFRWPNLLNDSGRGLGYGGDYNPDQWPESVWDDDIRLMRQARVNMVSLAIFSWDRIQPSEDVWDFDWLDRIIDKLGKAGIAVDLASATASAPMWLYAKHPEVLPVEADGTVVHAGSRQSWRPTSPVYRQYALEVCRRLAERYGDNPYVTAWHVGNEYGWNNAVDYSPDAQRAFREWCRERYGDVQHVNEAWGAAFWSQEVRSFDEIDVPRHMGNDAMVNPSKQLDFTRFCSDALRTFYMAERDVIASICPDKPITTNFMVSTDQCAVDYAAWSREVDFVSNDHYFTAGEAHLDELACSDSLVSGFADGNPWCLMEHSTSAVQWKPINSRKRSGELMRDALSHVAFGADSINFFQWRQSRSGAEAFHSAMVPHAGENTSVFNEVCELGKTLSMLGDAGLQGSAVRPSDVAILFSADAEWATRSQTLPTTRLSHWHGIRDWYRALLDIGVRADVVPLAQDWEGYRTVILPTMLTLADADVRRLAAFVQSGGRMVVDYASGLVDDSFHVGLGGYPGCGGGLLREMLGVRGEEINILGPVDGEFDLVRLSNGTVSRLWQNVVTSVADDATVVAYYDGVEAREWELQGVPAIVRHPYGEGETYYVGCDLNLDDLASVIGSEAFAEVSAQVGDPRFIRVARDTECGSFDFLFNRQSQPVTVKPDPAWATVLLEHRCRRLDDGTIELDRNGAIVAMDGV